MHPLCSHICLCMEIKSCGLSYDFELQSLYSLHICILVHNLHPVSFIKLKDDLYSEMNKYLADDGEEQSEG